jgi:hypothetical protein
MVKTYQILVALFILIAIVIAIRQLTPLPPFETSEPIDAVPVIEDSGWYNFVTNEYVSQPLTDQEAVECLPDAPTRNLYLIYREEGQSIVEAMITALTHYLGVE